MSAARKYDDAQMFLDDYSRSENRRQQMNIKRKTKISQSMNFTEMIPIFVCLIMICGLSILVIYRYVQMNQLQLQIFETSQAIKSHEKEIKALEVKKESSVTIEEIQLFATEKLSMVMPSEKNKVILKTDEYFILNQNIAFKNGDTLHAEALDPNNKQVSADE